MKTTRHIKAKLAALLLTFGFPGLALSQSDGPAIAAPISNWDFVGHSSTYAEGVQRGYASVLRGTGELAYLDSLAAINYQEAFKRALENRVAYTKAVMDIKAMRAEYRERYASRPLSPEARKRIQEYYQPKKLTATQFNPDTNAIVWPHILRQSEFAPLCKEISEVFKSRTFENSGDGSPTQRDIYRLTKSLAALLRENINSMSAEQYSHASEFIRSLNLEAKSVVPPKNNGEEIPAQNDLIEATPPVENQIDKAEGAGTVPVKVRAKI